MKRTHKKTSKLKLWHIKLVLFFVSLILLLHYFIMFFALYTLQSPLVITVRSPIISRFTSPVPDVTVTPLKDKEVTPTPTPTPTPPARIESSQKTQQFEYERVSLSDSQRTIANTVEERIGKTGAQLVYKESGFNPHAINSSSGACGLFQAYPCSKLGCELDNLECQLLWGEEYILQRYGSPAKALEFHKQHGWY